MITVQLIGDKELIAKLDSMPGRVHDGLLRAVTRLGFALQRKVQVEKLSGQVLNVRTGSLRSSINTRVQDGKDQITATVGTNIKYAHVHEYGYDGDESVRAHLRTIKQAFGRPIAPTTVNVGPFTRHMHMPERSFLRSALREMQPQIEEELQKAVDEAVK